MYTDPESHTWDPLDGELSKKLDERPYVSLSRDRQTSTTTGDDNAATQEADTEINDEEVSLFDLNMPGNMTLDEVKALDLDHWLLLVHGTFVHMIVSPHFNSIFAPALAAYLYIWMDGWTCV